MATNSWIHSLLCICLLCAKIQFNHRISICKPKKKKLKHFVPTKKKYQYMRLRLSMCEVAKNGSFYKVFSFLNYMQIAFIAFNSIDRAIDRLLWYLLISFCHFNHCWPTWHVSTVIIIKNVHVWIISMNHYYYYRTRDRHSKFPIFDFAPQPVRYSTEYPVTRGPWVYL